MSILDRLLSPWHAVQRAIDVRELWYGLKLQAVQRDLTLDHAKAAFKWHAMHDEAWLCLGEAEIDRRIDRLK